MGRLGRWKLEVSSENLEAEVRDIWVFDLDDTLADTRHRAHLKPQSKGHGEEWVPYSMACAADGVHTPTSVLFKWGALGHDCWIVTGRTEHARHLTEMWLERKGLLPGLAGLEMRAIGDHRPNVELKLAALDRFEKMGRNITLWVDDYRKVIEAVAARGIPTVHFRAVGGDMNDDPARRPQ